MDNYTKLTDNLISYEGHTYKITNTPINKEHSSYRATLEAIRPGSNAVITHQDLAELDPNHTAKNTPIRKISERPTAARARAAVLDKLPALAELVSPVHFAAITAESSFRNALAIYLAKGSPSQKASSYLRNHVQPVLGQYALQDITADLLSERVKALIRADKKAKRPLSDINLHISYIAACFGWLVSAQYYPLDCNPAVHLDLLRVETQSRAQSKNRRRDRLTDSERNALFGWCGSHPGWVAAAIMLLYNGIDAAELPALDTDQLETIENPDGNEPILSIWICEKLIQGDHQYVARPLPVAKIRRLPLFSNSLVAYRAYRAGLRSPSVRGPLIGDGPDGTVRLTPVQIRDELAEVMTALGIGPNVLPDGSTLTPTGAEGLLRSDLQYCLSDPRLTLYPELASMVVGSRQPTTNGRHYFDLDCDETQLLLWDFIKGGF